jgi:5S rRNA maturation endonuclease (ribonuclease M5)
MRHENGDKIIIGKDKADGHYIYFNPNDEGDSGTIIDFVKNRTGETLGHIRKRLRSWLHNPQPQENIPVKASTKDALRIANIWSAIEETTSYFDSHWGVHHLTLDRLQRMRNVKRGKDHEYYFALSDLNGICGIERRTREDKHIIKGSAKGVFVDGEIKEAKEIVIFESPVDMISYMELHNQIYDTDRYYVCTMGSIGESAEKSLEAIFTYNKDANIIVAVDNDQGGDTITEKIATILSRVDGNVSRASRHKPTMKDWNDDLKADKQEQEQTHTQTRRLRP